MFLSFLCFFFFLFIVVCLCLAGGACIFLIMPAAKRQALMEGIKAKWSNIRGSVSR